MKNQFDTPLTAQGRCDINAMIRALLELQERGTIKSYATNHGQTGEDAIFEIRRQVDTLMETDFEVEEELSS